MAELLLGWRCMTDMRNVALSAMQAEKELPKKDSLFFDLAQSSRLLRLSRLVQRRSEKLLILCYHGISKTDEHQWRPTLYMPRQLFRQRLQTLHNFGCQVLPLGTALERLYAGTLQGPTVVLTFDDGWHDFYSQAWPELQSFGYPATVYQTTYYSLYQRPVFDTACSYLLWKARGRILSDKNITGTDQSFTLQSPESIQYAFQCIADRLRLRGASGEEKDQLLGQLAKHLHVDYSILLDLRLLHLMTLEEVANISRQGADVQLHTHRHRLPLEKNAFLHEIRHNQLLLQEATGMRADHFCYPNGEHRPELPAWLREAGVVSATTCDPGTASRQSEPMMLVRAVDSCMVSPARFEAWLSGMGFLLNACKRTILSVSGYPYDNHEQRSHRTPKAAMLENNSMAAQVVEEH